MNSLEQSAALNRRSPASGGWAIRGKRWNVEKEMMEYFRSPPEPHTFTEETARHMHAAMTELHSGWEWEIISPNAKVSA